MAETGKRGGNGFGRSLLRALRNTDISVLYQDRDLRYVWTENVPQAWTARSLVGAGDHDFLPEHEAERVSRAKNIALQTGEPQRLEISVPAETGTRWFDLWIDADYAESGEIDGIITTTVEITEQKWREQTLRGLLREVSHRSKNLLAIIQSIAAQTGRHSDNVDDFLARFRGRLHSLASSQDLVTSSNWRGADLHELVASQLARYCANPLRNVRLEGKNPYLNPNAALHVGLAIHELAVNSVSFGALAREDGQVTISAHPRGETDAAAADLELTWREKTNVAADRFRNNKRFGSVALERVVPASIDGKASFSANKDGIVYRLTIPGGNFVID